MRGKLKYLFLATALLAFPPQLLSQHKVPIGVLSNGGGIAHGSNTVYCTIGQAIVGISELGGPQRCKSGFWYLAEIESAVEVAITAFTCEFRDDAVHLLWSVSTSTSYRGTKIYRSEGANGGFRELTPEFIPVGTNEYTDNEVIPGRTYIYYICVENQEKQYYSQMFTVSIPPKPLTLYQNYPNPFNPSTTITFFLPERSHVKLALFDVQGKLVRTLVNETKETGKNVMGWDGRNDLGRTVGSGVYYCRLVVGKDILTKKLVVIR